MSALATIVSAAILWLRPGPTPPAPAAAVQTVTIEVGDVWFCDESFQGGVCDTVIYIGDTVVWDFSPAELPHTTTECGVSCDDPTDTPVWDSDLMPNVDDPLNPRFQFEFTFNETGTYLYYCVIHPILHRGRIFVVEPGQEPTATPTATSTPDPSPTPTLTPPGPRGDVNCDSTINSIDAALVLQHDTGLIGSLSCQENADANEDGAVNAIDVALILQLDAGLIDSLPP
jgi:hypothetical protein